MADNHQAQQPFFPVAASARSRPPEAALHGGFSRLNGVTGENVELAWVDQGYTGPEAAQAAEHGFALEVVKLSEAKKGFVLLPRRWVVERTFGWIVRCRRLARDYKRVLGTFAGLHWIMFSRLLLARLHFQSFVSS